MDVGCLYWWKILFGHYYANLALHMYVYIFFLLWKIQHELSLFRT